MALNKKILGAGVLVIVVIAIIAILLVGMPSNIPVVKDTLETLKIENDSTETWTSTDTNFVGPTLTVSRDKKTGKIVTDQGTYYLKKAKSFSQKETLALAV